ncbi:MAG: DnaB-like helicase C-terminal domain-containing protein [Thiothrix sp.]|uniref:DnaB-like helicase C-terminal domain-containing protein n=1 Tax=Thiothrix sp. TaxID=1032 RepID=UPI00260A88CD|nr:DnaB-like helicase C-terminal domain-containing protein [Thiothrix sp.]MDD5394910.1 DnaB-like helicase C-terminal domain-containing protein [Thiothrix sp.]
MIDRIPPSVASEENIIISTCLRGYGLLKIALDTGLKPEDFYSTDNRDIFIVLTEMFQTQKPFDYDLLMREIVSRKIFTENEFIDYTVIFDTESGGICPCHEKNIPIHAKLIMDASIRRKTIEEATKIINDSFNDDVSLADLHSKTENFYLDISGRINGLSEEKNRPELISPLSRLENMREFNSDKFRARGVSTGFKSLDEFYKPAKGTLNIINGIPGHGKSELMDAIALNIAKDHGWKWCMFSPENYPTELHLQKLAEKYLSKSIYNMTAEEIDEAISWLEGYFRFVKLSEDRHGLNDLMSLIYAPVKNGEFDALVIDPWNELDINLADEKETDYIGRSLSRLRRFGRRNNIAIFIVAHPAKMYKDKDAQIYNVPTLYDLAGSAHWYNKADNGLTIHRDFEKNQITIHVQKIKYKIHGKVGLDILQYDRDSGNFYTLDDARAWQNNI